MKREYVEVLWDEFHTPVHVRAHCLRVAQIGEFLAKGLKNAGMDIDPEMVWIAGALHDVVRVVDFKQLPKELGTEEDQIIWKALRNEHAGKHHADAAADILNARGETTLADIIQRHKFSAIGTPEGPDSWESKVLYYADKRVAHEQVVSLEERLREGRSRHFGDEPKTPEDQKNEHNVFELEREIFKHLDCGPDEVIKRYEEPSIKVD